MRGVKRAILKLFRFFFPRSCPTCLQPFTEQQPAPICASCLAAIRPLPVGRCSCCSLPFRALEQSSHLCGRCLVVLPAFTHVYAVGYHEHLLRKAIYQFKFNGRVDLDFAFGWLLDQQVPVDCHYDIVVPVPLSLQRLRQRGFNQSLLLARQLGRRRGINVAVDLLLKIKETHNQQELDAAHRKTNLKQAFSVNCDLSGQRILLVDDVMTTGETVNVCSALLQQAGAAVVDVAVLGRAI